MREKTLSSQSLDVLGHKKRPNFKKWVLNLVYPCVIAKYVLVWNDPIRFVMLKYWY